MIQNFTVNDFEGPLDLLLHLIRSSKMDIYNINVESITKQYIELIIFAIIVVIQYKI